MGIPNLQDFVLSTRERYSFIPIGWVGLSPTPPSYKLLLLHKDIQCFFRFIIKNVLFKTLFLCFQFFCRINNVLSKYINKNQSSCINRKNSIVTTKPKNFTTF